MTTRSRPTAPSNKSSPTNIELAALGEAEEEEAVVDEVVTALRKMSRRAARLRLEALLSGEADGNDCYLEVHAGAGGTESQDWAEMLIRMYLRWAERHEYKIEWIAESLGEEARHQVGHGARQRR